MMPESETPVPLFPEPLKQESLNQESLNQESLKQEPVSLSPVMAAPANSRPAVASLKSGIFFGKVSHQRLGAIRHSFSYPMALLTLDLDELKSLAGLTWLFGLSWAHPLRFCASDYLKSATNPNPNQSSQKASIPGAHAVDSLDAIEGLKQRVLTKASELGAEGQFNKVVFAGQVRQFGFYFSPVNFFFLGQGNSLSYLLAEVSNTPWNQRHCYLVPLAEAKLAASLSDKAFHVSPFMTLAMRYRWLVDVSDKVFHLQIDNEDYAGERLFRAGMKLRGQAFDKAGLWHYVSRFPLYTLYILYSIYRQALSLYRKGVTFVAHPGSAEK